MDAIAVLSLAQGRGVREGRFEVCSKSQGQPWLPEKSELLLGCIKTHCRDIVPVDLGAGIDVRSSSAPFSLTQALVERAEGGSDVASLY